MPIWHLRQRLIAMEAPPAGISEADWLTWPAGARTFILAQQDEIEQLRAQLTALATELANLRKRIGRSSQNSSKPPSSDGPGFKTPERHKGSYFPLELRQLCWAHVIRDLTAIAERSGASGEIGAELLALQQQLFAQWHRYKDGTIDWPTLQQACGPIRQAFVATLQRVVELGHRRGERTPWAKTVGTCHKLLPVADGLWTFLKIKGIEPTNNAAERALRQSVIQRKISHGVQSRQGAICRDRLLTVTTTLRQQSRDIWDFLEQAWITHHRGGVMPSLLPEP
jgi:hypothetical protein